VGRAARASCTVSAVNEDVTMPSVRAYMVLSTLAELGETLACRPEPNAVDEFTGRDIDAWVVSERTDAELSNAASSVPEVEAVEVFEAVPDTAVDSPETIEADDTATAPAAAAAPAAPAAKPAGHHKGSSTVRVDAERLDQLMHFMGELVLHRTQVEALAARADVPGLSQAMQNLTRSSHALQSMVMQVRMIPGRGRSSCASRGSCATSRPRWASRSTCSSSARTPSSTARRRRARRSARAPRAQRARPRARSRRRSASPRGKPETGTLEISAPPRRRQRRHQVRDDGRGSTR
jgi:two-component system chemotaxis sensor kinase CheA